MDSTEIRRAIIANGYAPVPILTRQKFPGRADWQQLARNATAESVARWPADHTGTGILCGPVLGVDFDVSDPDIVDELECVAIEALGNTPLRRVGNAPKIMLVYRSADPAQRWMKTPKLFLPNGDPAHVEVRAAGQQFVAFGIHPDTGRPYSWGDATPADTPAASLPVIDESGLRAFLAECECVLRAYGCTGADTGVAGGSSASRKSYADLAPPSAAAVIDLLNRLPNPITTDRAQYLEVGFAAKGCTDGLEAVDRLADGDADAIRHAWVQWACRWPESPGEDAEAAKWDNDLSTRDRPLAGWSTLERHAARAIPGYGAERAAEDFATLPAEPAIETWRRDLQVTSTGNIRGNLINACLAIRHGAACLALNEFTDNIVYTAVPPWDARTKVGQPIKDHDYLAAGEWLQKIGIQAAGRVPEQAIKRVAVEFKFDPMREWLESLKWDGVSRIDTWLIDHLGADDSPYVRAVASKMLIASVARIFEPGCQVDTVGLLEGDQGIGKSSALREMYGTAVFVDHMPDLGQKDAILQLAGMWGVEFAEMDKLNRSESAVVKEWLSRRHDNVRRPYGIVTEAVPRRCVFWATINPGGAGYLNDETGNRRYWPVRCGSGQVDIRALREVRGQLWAEAVARYQDGEIWWLQGDIEAAQRAAVAERFAEDAWSDRIVEYLSDKQEVAIGDVMAGLGLMAHQWNHGHMTRAARTLTALGWIRRQVRTENGRAWRYFPLSLSPVSAIPLKLVTK